MTTMRRPGVGHPRKVVLEAWFDGEGDQWVGQHVIACVHCRRHLDEVARLRMWIRGDIPDAVARSATGGRASRWRPNGGQVTAVLVVVGLAALAILLPSTARPRSDADSVVASAAVRSGGRFPGPDDGGPPPLQELTGARTGEPTAPTPPAAADSGSGRPPVSGGTKPNGRGPTGDTPFPTGGSSAAGSGSSTVAGPLAASVPIGVRLGLVVPRAGPGAREGAEVERVVRLRIDLANAVGGVNGWRVGLEIAPAEDDAAVRKLTERVDALVGGFGVTTALEGLTVPWLLPADPAIEGPTVVRAEPVPRRAGERLADQLRTDGATGVIGVVVDATIDATLADGLGPNVVRATATGSNCDNEIATLRQREVVVVALAAAPLWVARCLDSLEAAKFRPVNGVLLAPSAIYAGLLERSAGSGARSILGLPWPTAPDSGGARFRVSTGSTSYRALVSFAAVELAVDSARTSGGRVGPIPGQRFRTDLIHVGENDNEQTTVVAAGPVGWLPVPNRR